MDVHFGSHLDFAKTGLREITHMWFNFLIELSLRTTLPVCIIFTLFVVIVDPCHYLKLISLRPLSVVCHAVAGSEPA